LLSSSGLAQADAVSLSLPNGWRKRPRAPQGSPKFAFFQNNSCTGAGRTLTKAPRNKEREIYQTDLYKDEIGSSSVRPVIPSEAERYVPGQIRNGGGESKTRARKLEAEIGRTNLSFQQKDDGCRPGAEFRSQHRFPSRHLACVATLGGHSQATPEGKLYESKYLQIV
jgi:hypothetical protein